MDEVVDLFGGHLHGAPLEVQYGECLLDSISLGFGASGKDPVEQDLVGLDVVFHQSLITGDLEELLQLQGADSFYIDGAALKKGGKFEVTRGSYQFVSFVIAVRVESLDLRQFGEQVILNGSIRGD